MDRKVYNMSDTLNTLDTLADKIREGYGYIPLSYNRVVCVLPFLDAADIMLSRPPGAVTPLPTTAELGGMLETLSQAMQAAAEREGLSLPTSPETVPETSTSAPDARRIMDAAGQLVAQLESGASLPIMAGVSSAMDLHLLPDEQYFGIDCPTNAARMVALTEWTVWEDPTPAQHRAMCEAFAWLALRLGAPEMERQSIEDAARRMVDSPMFESAVAAVAAAAAPAVLAI